MEPYFPSANLCECLHACFGRWEVIGVPGFGDSRKKFQAGVAFSCRRLVTEEAICKPSFRPHLDYWF